TVGALLALKVANNLYVQIGLVLLIALSAKNAILIVEMALEGRAAGKSLEEATVHASEVRFRPIVMTSFTFILGVLPLLTASGAAGRQPVISITRAAPVRGARTVAARSAAMPAIDQRTIENGWAGASFAPATIASSPAHAPSASCGAKIPPGTPAA